MTDNEVECKNSPAVRVEAENPSLSVAQHSFRTTKLPFSRLD
jgi:hypothetical protein